MTPPTASPLECLPQVLLEQICEYLSDDSVKRCALWAFSLTSKRCCDAATPRRFCQIQLSVTTANTLMAELGRWNELFGRIDGYRYVRRLKVLGTKRNAPQMPTRQEEKEEEEDLEDEIGWKMRNSFAMHDFCCPSVASMDSTIMFSTKDYPEAYSSLTRFIGRLTTLKDMVWAGGGNIPRPVLSAVHAGGCRLHVRFFRLRSLIQSRDQPQPIDPDDWALASSPSLTSTVASYREFETDGTLNYTKEAVMRMVAGTAPNLTHLWLERAQTGDSMAYREALTLGRPAWQGFFPGTVEADKPPSSAD